MSDTETDAGTAQNPQPKNRAAWSEASRKDESSYLTPAEAYAAHKATENSANGSTGVTPGETFGLLLCLAGVAGFIVNLFVGVSVEPYGYGSRYLSGEVVNLSLLHRSVIIAVATAAAAVLGLQIRATAKAARLHKEVLTALERAAS